MKRRFLLMAFGLLVLATIVLVPLISNWGEEFDVETSVRTQLDTVLARLEEFKIKHGNYPITDAEINTFFSNDGPKRTDWWGMPIHYSLENGKVLLYSYGPDLEDNEGQKDDLMPTAISN